MIQKHNYKWLKEGCEILLSIKLKYVSNAVQNIGHRYNTFKNRIHIFYIVSIKMLYVYKNKTLNLNQWNCILLT